MKFFASLSVILLLALSLSACSSPKRNTDVATLLIPLPPNPIDPSDILLKTAVQNYLRSSGSPVASRYQMKRYDLNNDGRREGLVFVNAPYGHWCGVHGCAVLVFKAHDKGFTFVNKIQPVRAPVYVSHTSANGWKNLVVHVAGRMNDKARDVKLEFNGRSYPRDPSAVQSIQMAGSGGFSCREGVRLFYE